MKQIFIKINNDNEVTDLLKTDSRSEHWIATGYEHVPSHIEIDKIPVLKWNGTELYYDYQEHVEMLNLIEEDYIPETIQLTNDEIDSYRAKEYRLRVDPITCEIMRLRDMSEDDN